MVQHLMSDMSGDRIRPLRGFREFWLRQNTGLYPVLVYCALSGLTRAMLLFAIPIMPLRAFREFWLRQNTGLYPVLVYYALSGLTRVMLYSFYVLVLLKKGYRWEIP